MAGFPNLFMITGNPAAVVGGLLVLGDPRVSVPMRSGRLRGYGRSAVICSPSMGGLLRDQRDCSDA
jgi:hypothetical protein